MKLREFFEAQLQQTGPTIGVCFGRFNPPHKGHKSAWETAAQFDDFYVGTNQSTQGPKDPLPYDVKLVAMQTIWPEIAGHVIPEQNLFTLATRVYKQFGESANLRVCTDEDWLTASLQKYNGKEGPHGYFKFASIEQEPTPRLSSATALRAAVKAGDREAFSSAAGVSADTPIKVEGKRSVRFFDLVKHYLSQFPEPVKKKKKELAEECAGVGIITKQNSTADVGPGTIKKNLKAFKLSDDINVDEGILTTDVAHALKRYGEHVNNDVYKELAKMFSLGKIADALFMLKRLDPEVRKHATNIISGAGGLLGSRLIKESHMSELHAEIGDYLDGPLSGYKDHRVDADTLGNYCVKLAHLLSRKHNIDQDGMQHLINDYVDNALSDDELYEGKSRKNLRKSFKQSMSNLSRYDVLDNNNQPYLAYRFGIALAGSPDNDMDKRGPLGSSFTMADYSDADTEIRRGAEKVMGVKQSSSTGKGSEELNIVNIVSPVAKPKRNKYGI